MKIYLSCLLLLLFSSVNAQTQFIHHPEMQFLFEDSLLRIPSFHSALLPLEVTKADFFAINKLKPDTIHKIFAAPVFDGTYGFQLKESENNYGFGQGAYLSSNLGKKAGFEFSAVLYEQKFPGQNYFIDSLKLVPGNNRPLWGKNEDAGYLNVRGQIWWKPNRWLTFRLGNDKHFIGDGYRSLMLSENAAATPFFQTQLKIWKIQYEHQVMFLRDLVYGKGNMRLTKYISQHVLSYNITSRLNAYIFETVIWRKQDSIRYRGFDLTYLNPFLFFRPVEFNQGSPDNVLMGVGGKLRVFGKSYLYGQLLLDEFRLQELIANNGWWGNKYGYQIGFKTYCLFRNKPSLFSIEYNQVRPFTYSHTYSMQNYGYLMQPLAHPSGSNFKEIDGVFRMALSGNWFIHLTGIFLRYGENPPGQNYGSDIYEPQWTFSKLRSNYTTQGILNTVVMGEVKISRVLISSWRLHAFSSFSMTAHKVAGKTDYFPEVQFGIQTLLYE